MTYRLKNIDRQLVRLITQLQMAQLREEPAFIDREKMELAVPAEYDYFCRYEIGETFGKYGEEITKLVRAKRGDEAPFWFTPKERANHVAVVSPYGTMIYMELRHDRQARAEQHPFDLTVAVLAKQAPRIISLFDGFDNPELA